MLKGELLANRLYELFGPISMDTNAVADNELNRALNRRGISTVGDFNGGVRLVKLGAGARAGIPSMEGYRFWVFYCSEQASLTRMELDILCIGHGLERAPLASEASPYGSLDKGEPWWGVYQPRAGNGFLSDTSEEALDLMARYAHAAKSVRAGDRVLILGIDADSQRFISDITAAREVVAGVSADQLGADLFDTVIDVEDAMSTPSVAVSALMRPAGVLVTTRKHRWADVGLADNSAVWQKTSSPRGISQADGDVEITILRKPYLVFEPRFEDHADILGGDPGRGLDFSRYYVFPHIVRAIVNRQHRCADTGRLRAECEALLGNVALTSSDAGAALCVLSYASPEQRFSVDDARVADYLGVSSVNPHVVRWQISLAYVRGEAFMAAGDFAQALAAFETCLSFDAGAFHLSILTKQVGACLKIAHLAAALGNPLKAAEHLQQGASLGRKVCGADPDTVFGSREDPRFFYFGEIAEVLTLTSRCAYAYEQWRRKGADGLRSALAESTDLFRSPRACDLRDIALQRKIIDDLRRQLAQRQHLECSAEQMSMTAFFKLAVKVVAAKARSKISRWCRS